MTTPLGLHTPVESDYSTTQSPRQASDHSHTAQILAQKRSQPIVACAGTRSPKRKRPSPSRSEDVASLNAEQLIPAGDGQAGADDRRATLGSTAAGAQQTGPSETRTDRHSRPRRAPKTKREPRYISVTAICEELEISRSTFYDWRAKHKAPEAFPLPNGDLRITRANYEAWLKALEGAQ